ncbi:MAG: hypothetical protein L3J30_13625, partial [Marinosulfonomonas sp.]|nr:hypothetical protein [Marinosulfonomonas sp.]
MADNQIKRIALADITVRDDRVTPLNEDAVRLIEQSAAETGEIRVNRPLFAGGSKVSKEGAYG